MNLTSYQATVAQHDSSHALCVAVAGSGKTSTLSHLVNNLLAKNTDARRMMVMMFNKSAQVDFSGKLKKLCQHHPQIPEVRTYHSTGLRLLRTLEGWNARDPYNKKPLSDKVIELKLREFILATASAPIKERMRSDAARYIEAAVNFIDAAKSNLMTPENWYEKSGLPPEYRFFIKIFHLFEQWRHQNKSITFTDMLYDPMCIVQQQPDLVPAIENKVDYIIVDEYQDTSTLQHAFTRLIAGQRAKVIAVGDPDQTIYEFAGANIENILNNFQNDLGCTAQVSEMTLPHTFRYGHSLALAASHLINHNQARKDVLSVAHDSNHATQVKLIKNALTNDSKQLIKSIRELLSEGKQPEDIALLVRVWAQAVPIELNFLQEGIPYTSEGPSLFIRPEIEALLAPLKLAAGLFPLYEPDIRGKHLTIMLTLPHIGLKNRYVQQIVQQLQNLEQGYGDALEQLCQRICDLSFYQQEKLRTRARVFRYLEQHGQKEIASKLLRLYLRDIEIKESLRSMSLNEQRTDEQILAIDGFLQFIKQLGQDARESCFHINDLIQRHRERRSDRRASENNKVITISSSHKAKGLEWPVVIIPGLTRQYWPFIRDDDLKKTDLNDIEAERRLLYVAMTRAERELHLFTCTDSGDTWNAEKSQIQSPFLQEMNLALSKKIASLIDSNNPDEVKQQLTDAGMTKIARRYLKTVKPQWSDIIQTLPDIKKQAKTRKHHAARQAIAQLKHNTSSEDAPWQMHRQVRHSIFGYGTVTDVNDSNFSISFERKEYGTKRFARNNDVKILFEW